MKKYYQFRYLLQQSGWAENRYVGVDENGIITSLSSNPPVDESAIVEKVTGAAVPGFVNAHSHSFQYAMAGQAEIHRPQTEDDFWTWREAMYRCALSMSPDAIEAVTTRLYQNLIENGYTHVVEFHYLHHDIDGTPYRHIAETGERIIAAAQTTGIKLTLVPIYYNTGDFGMPARPNQRRFISKELDDYLQLLEATAKMVNQYDDISLGYGPHSLRAVPAEDVRLLFETVHQQRLPFHIHLSEQQKEVAKSVDYLGARPVQWMLEHLAVDDSFNFVHCTHLTPAEAEQLARSNANVVLCPSTEGNLGDGIFALTEFYQHGGNWAIGTDSQIQLNPLEDLRWLDYGQRLTRHRRNTFDNGAATMIEKLFFSGNKAAGNRYADYFYLGQPLDAVIYDLTDPVLEQATTQNLLPAIIYTSGRSHIAGTIINGSWKYKK